MELGASGVMVAPPPTLRTDDQIVGYFDMVTETLGADVPWVLQDHPVATGVQMSTVVILKIMKNSPSCVMLKHEDCPGLAKLTAIRAASDEGEVSRVAILTGNGGGLFLPEELSRGADGAMTGFAYPEMMVGVAMRMRQATSSPRTIFSTPTCRWPATSSRPARPGGAQAHHGRARHDRLPPVRKPGPKLSSADIADIARLVRRRPTPSRARIGGPGRRSRRRCAYRIHEARARLHFLFTGASRRGSSQARNRDAALQDSSRRACLARTRLLLPNV